MKAKRALPPFAWPLAGLVALLALNLAINPGFLALSMLDGHLVGTPVDILNRGAHIMLLALGMSLVIATGGIDLSVGSIMAISGSVVAILLESGMPLPVALAGALGISMLAGAANGALVTRFGVQPIVATLILMVAGRGVAQMLTEGRVVLVPDAVFGFLGRGFVAGLPFAAVFVAALFVLTHLFLRRTAAGLFVEAVGDGETASAFAGLRASRVKFFAYVFSGACAGVTGLIAAADIGAADSLRAGENMELDAIFAVVVGGTALTGGRFYLLGSFIGGLLLQTLTVTMYNIGVSPAIAPVPKALVIIAVCVLQSERTRRWMSGLFMRRAAA
ncbi:MAG: ABC transporter permease [Opitutaceae bacterium]